MTGCNLRSWVSRFFALAITLTLAGCGGGGGGSGDSGSPGSPTWSSPALTAPPSAASSGSIVDLRWKKVTLGSDKDAAAYTVKAGVDAENLEVISTCENIDALSCSFTAPEVNDDTTYYVRIEAFETAESTEPVSFVDHEIMIKPREPDISLGDYHSCALMSDK